MNSKKFHKCRLCGIKFRCAAILAGIKCTEVGIVVCMDCPRETVVRSNFPVIKRLEDEE